MRREAGPFAPGGGCSYKPKTRRSPCRSTAGSPDRPVRTEQAPTTQVAPFAPDTGAPTTQNTTPPVGAPPPVRTACPARPNTYPHSHPQRVFPQPRAPENKLNRPYTPVPVGAPPPVRTLP